MKHTSESEGTERHSAGCTAERDPPGPRLAGDSGERQRRWLRTGPLEAGRRHDDPRRPTPPQEGYYTRVTLRSRRPGEVTRARRWQGQALIPAL